MKQNLFVEINSIHKVKKIPLEDLEEVSCKFIMDKGVTHYSQTVFNDSLFGYTSRPYHYVLMR